MERTLVISRTIRSVGYDRARRVLQVEFVGGKVYDYLDVPQAKYDGLMSATSKGTYLNEHIRELHSFVRR